MHAYTVITVHVDGMVRHPNAFVYIVYVHVILNTIVLIHVALLAQLLTLIGTSQGTLEDSKPDHLRASTQVRMSREKKPFKRKEPRP